MGTLDQVGHWCNLSVRIHIIQIAQYCHYHFQRLLAKQCPKTGIRTGHRDVVDDSARKRYFRTEQKSCRLHFKKSVCFSSAVKNATQAVICRPVDDCSLSGRAVLLGQRAFQRKRNVWAEWQDDPSEGELSFHYKFGENNSDKFWSKIKSFLLAFSFHLIKFWENVALVVFFSHFPLFPLSFR